MIVVVLMVASQKQLLHHLVLTPLSVLLTEITLALLELNQQLLITNSTSAYQQASLVKIHLILLLIMVALHHLLQVQKWVLTLELA